MRSAVRDVLRVLFRHRRTADACAACRASADGACIACLRPHLARVARAVAEGEPIHCVLPAFPAKSPSAAKVLGPRADMAEEIALHNLQATCDEIAAVHAPGARITICSDGHVFSDVVGVSDADVVAYASDVRAIIHRDALHSLSTFALADLFGAADFAVMRARLLAEYAEPLHAVRAHLHLTATGRALYNGIHRFLFEDALPRATTSRNRVRRESGERAYAVIQRSRAWGAAVGAAFPDAVRLSIHPQPAHASKIGIRLVDAADAWLTPWHAVALEQGGEYRLVHRADAEAARATLVLRDGRPSHYRLAQHLETTVDHHREVA